jgi:hypothetical protein
MRVGVAHHGRFFGGVLDLAVAADLEAAAMPGVDSSFRAGEGVGLLGC